jgi:hypothetical protein
MGESLADCRIQLAAAPTEASNTAVPISAAIDGMRMEGREDGVVSVIRVLLSLFVQRRPRRS